MIDKSAEAINAFFSYLRAVLEDPDSIDPKTLEEEATNYLVRNPHVKDHVDYHSLIGGISERINIKETLNFGITDNDKSIDHIDWYENYLDKNFNNRPYWQRYFNYFLSTGLSSVVLKGIDNSTDQILSKCENPNRLGQWSNKGLVVGVVQGGKTTNMIGLCNKAIDAGYRLIIIIPGLLEDLRLQTHERFDAGLIGRDTTTTLEQDIKTFAYGVSNYNRKINVHNFTTANKRGDSFNDLKKLTIYDTKHTKEPSIVIVKKNTKVLKNLFLKIALNENAFKKEPVLIIDDESDLASINTETIKNIEKETQYEIKTTPKYIRAILSLFDKSAYIGYTATPYANIFQHYREKAEEESTLPMNWRDKNREEIHRDKKVNLGEGLFPKNFVCSLPIYSNYIGFEKMFGDNFFEEGEYSGNNVIERVFDYVDPHSYQKLDTYYSNIHKPKKQNPKPYKSEITGWMSPWHPSDWEPNNHSEDIPRSLKKAICFFILSNIVKKIRKIKPIHNSMLINVSRYIKTNESISIQVQNYLNNITGEYGLGDNESPIKQYFKSLWGDEFENKINEDYIFPSRKIIWDEIENSISNELRKVKTLTIAGDNDYLNYTDSKSESIIAVGGTKLSRGITLEGLSVSYFLRKSDTSSADSVTQMGRWFGYRPRYDDVCKLFLTEFLLDDFREYYEAEEDLRSQLTRMNKKGLTPTEFGMMVKMRRPAASNKMKYTERHRINRDFSGKRKQLIFINIDKNKDNITATKSMFEKLSKICNPIKGNGSKYWENIDSKIVLDFLESYQSPAARSRFTEESYIEYINSCNEIGDELKSWNVALVSNLTGKKIGDKLIGSDFVAKNREYEPKNGDEKLKKKLTEWSGKPEELNKFKGSEEGIFRIGALTEKKYEYLDLNISQEDAKTLIEKEKSKDKNKKFNETDYWRTKREKPILIIYPIKSKGDENSNYIYISYEIIFPYSEIVQNNYDKFKPVWETLNPVLIDQLKNFKEEESN